MGIMKASVALAIGLLGAASAIADPVLPAVANVSIVPVSSAAGDRIGSSGRVGVSHSKDSSNLASGAAIAIAVLAVGAVGAGVYSGVHGGHGSSSVSP